MKTVFHLLFFSFVSVLAHAQPQHKLIHQEFKKYSNSEILLYAVSHNARIVSYSAIINIYGPAVIKGDPKQTRASWTFGQGMVSLVVPENIDVDYDNIKIRFARNVSDNSYITYRPPSDTELFLKDLLKLGIGLIPGIGSAIGAGVHLEEINANPDVSSTGNFIDQNKYDIVTAGWGIPSSSVHYPKVRVDIPVSNARGEKVGLYAFWQNRESTDTGPVSQTNNKCTAGLNLRVDPNRTTARKEPARMDPAPQAQSQSNQTHIYRVSIKGGGGKGTHTKLRMNFGQLPIKIIGKGSSDDSDEHVRIGISTSDANYYSFQRDSWTDLSSYCSKRIYLVLDSKWGSDIDSNMELEIHFREDPGISYDKLDNNDDDLEYLRIDRIR